MARTIRQSDFEKKDFVPQELIEKLTTSVDLKEQRDNNNNNNSGAVRKGFNPENYLTSFENAIEQIRLLRNDVDTEIEKSIQVSKTDEANYKSQLSGFMTDLHTIMHEFRILDGSISKVSQTAIRIGDRLENVEDQRQQILETEELIGHFLRFNKDKQYRGIDGIFIAESGDKLYKAARLIIKLEDIANDVSSLQETLNAKNEIKKISNRIKKNLKDEFIRAWQATREDKHAEMKECASLLDEFNDAEARDEFLGLYLRDVDYHSYSATSYVEVEKSVAQFTSDLSRVLETACKSIMRVFPKPELVVKDLIIKAFREQLLSYLFNATQPLLLGTQMAAFNTDAELSKSGTTPAIDDSMSEASHEFASSGPDLQRVANVRGGLPPSAVGQMSAMSTATSTTDTVSDAANLSNVSRLNRKELEEYLSIINIVYTHCSDLIQELKTKILEIVFNSNRADVDENREKLYSVRHVVEEEVLMKSVFESHQQNYLKLELKHLRGGLKELIRKHIFQKLKLDVDDLSDDEFGDGNAYGNQQGDRSSMDDAMDDLDDPRSAATLQISVTDDNAAASDADNASGGNNKKKTRFALSAFTKSKAPKFNLMQNTKQYSQRKLKKIKKMLPASMSSKEFEEVLSRLRNVFQFDLNICVATMRKRVNVSLSRCAVISSPKEVSENCRRVFLVYLDAVDTLFRKTLIPICKETLPKKGVRAIKNWYFLEAVQNTNSALQLVEQCYINQVTPNMSDTFEAAICKESKLSVYHDFEQDILAGLKELLSLAVDISAAILRKEQQKIDFKPKQDEIDTFGATKACQNACQFIEEFRHRSLVCLDGRNLDRFFLCLGTRLYYNIIEHFKDYQYNSGGAMLLVQDAKLYQSTVKEFHIEKINELFLTLVERANLISIPADSIAPYIDNDPKLSKIDKNELKLWLKLRTDYRSAKIESKLFV